MGYEFHVSAVNVSLQQNNLKVTLELENRGVAPFYYDWNAEYGLLLDGKVVTTIVSSGKLTGLLPGDKPREWNNTLDLSNVPPGKYTLAVRVPNTLPNGLPLRFANATQDRDVAGQGFTHKVGDTVAIATPRLGRLVNRVVHSKDAPAWEFGIGALIRNLAARGLLQ